MYKINTHILSLHLQDICLSLGRILRINSRGIFICKTKVLYNSVHVQDHVGMTNTVIYDSTSFNWLICVFVFSWQQVWGSSE